METRQAIVYSGITVGWRRYYNGAFLGYVWDNAAYRHYEMFVAKRKLC